MLEPQVTTCKRIGMNFSDTYGNAFNEDKKRKWEKSEETNRTEKKKFSNKSAVSGGGSKFSNKATSSGSYSKNRPETSQGKNSDKESRSICAYCGVIGHPTTLCQRSEHIYRNSVMSTPYSCLLYTSPSPRD